MAQNIGSVAQKWLNFVRLLRSNSCKIYFKPKKWLNWAINGSFLAKFQCPLKIYHHLILRAKYGIK